MEKLITTTAFYIIITYFMITMITKMGLILTSFAATGNANTKKEEREH